MKTLRILLTASALALISSAGVCAIPAAAPKDGTRLEKFNAAVTLYQNGKFDEAAGAFAHLAATGFETPGVYFNLGNSWVKSGRIGRALWAYERALLLDPRDEDIRFNRDLLRSSLGEPPAPETAPLLDPIKQLLRSVRTEEIGLAVEIATLLLVLWMLGFTYIRSWRPVFGTFFWLTLLASTLVWGSAWVRWNDVRFAAGIVQEKEVFVRYGPAESNSKAYPLKEGVFVRIEKISGDWYLIRLTNGQSGWIPKSAVLRVAP